MQAQDAQHCIACIASVHGNLASGKTCTFGASRAPQVCLCLGGSTSNHLPGRGCGKQAGERDDELGSELFEYRIIEMPSMEAPYRWYRYVWLSISMDVLDGNGNGVRRYDRDVGNKIETSGRSIHGQLAFSVQAARRVPTPCGTGTGCLAPRHCTSDSRRRPQKRGYESLW